MNQHLLREASDAALYREQLREVVKVLRDAEAVIGDACHATAIYGDQPPQMYLDALRTVQVALAKVRHD